MLKKLSIFGVTGSVGRSTIEVVENNPGQFEIDTFVAGRNVRDLAELARKFKPALAVIGDDDKYQELKELLSGSDVEAAAGKTAVLEAAQRPVDITMAAISGTAGLLPLLYSLKSSTYVAIANKEPLVAAGPLVIETAQRHKTTLLPVDSEHNAIFQVFEPDNKAALDKIILTASGGPFRTKSLDEIWNASPEQALAHPNWSMGAKISIDSATLMNKALEVIEAHYLFNVPGDMIDVVIHPQSIIHSMVSYQDGSILAQLGQPDMKTPIASALGYPERLKKGGDILSMDCLTSLSFEKPDFNRFPSLSMAYEALKTGQPACIALNAANETSVKAFLDERLAFGQITEINAKVLDAVPRTRLKGLDDILDLHKTMQDLAETYITEMT